MAQDPDRYESKRDSDVVRNTHALDMVTLRGGNVSTESEADVIRGVLDANEIPSVLIRAAQYPNLGYRIQVPRGMVVEAEEAVRDALAAGPAAAEAAESQTEK